MTPEIRTLDSTVEIPGHTNWNRFFTIFFDKILTFSADEVTEEPTHWVWKIVIYAKYLSINSDITVEIPVIPIVSYRTLNITRNCYTRFITDVE